MLLVPFPPPTERRTPWPLSHVERGQTAVEAVLAAICNELEVAPEAIPDHLFIALARDVALVLLALETPSIGAYLCPWCENIVLPQHVVRRTP